MPFFIDESKMINDNIFQYEEKMKSPMSRFLDVSPTFSTYYHINDDLTTTDAGYKDVDSIIGFRSPIRFHKINDFPLYGLEQIVLQLQEEEQGMDFSYSGEAVIMHGTVTPLPNDFFTINHLKKIYIFRVTEIQVDNIMPDNYFKINYQLEYTDIDMLQALEKQVIENFDCILENIGTEDKCIIKTESHEKIKEITKMYNEVQETFLTIYYNEKYNCLLGDYGVGKKIYDPLQSDFVNKHSLFNEQNNFKTIVLADQFPDQKRKIKYERSIYRFIERRDVKRINSFPYAVYSGTGERESSFSLWNDTSVVILDIPSNMEYTTSEILSDEFINACKNDTSIDNPYAQFVINYLKKDVGIHEIPMDLNESLLTLDANLEPFFFIPIILYIIRQIVKNELQEKK